MYKMLLLVLTIIIASSNGQTAVDESISIQTAVPMPVLGNPSAPENCVCRLNNEICSEPGCSLGDNLNCNGFRGNIFYSTYDSNNNYYRNVSACACPNFKGDDGFANVNYIDDDAVYAYNYTTCDNIATADSNVPAPSDVAVAASSCCYYCCMLEITAMGGD